MQGYQSFVIYNFETTNNKRTDNHVQVYYNFCNMYIKGHFNNTTHQLLISNEYICEAPIIAAMMVRPIVTDIPIAMYSSINNALAIVPYVIPIIVPDISIPPPKPIIVNNGMSSSGVSC